MANVEDQLNKSLDQLIKEHGGDRRGGGRGGRGRGGRHFRGGRGSFQGRGRHFHDERRFDGAQVTVGMGMERRDGVDLVYGWGLDEAGVEKFTVRCLHTDLLEVSATGSVVVRTGGYFNSITVLALTVCLAPLGMKVERVEAEDKSRKLFISKGPWKQELTADDLTVSAFATREWPMIRTGLEALPTHVTEGMMLNPPVMVPPPMVLGKRPGPGGGDWGVEHPPVFHRGGPPPFGVRGGRGAPFHGGWRGRGSYSKIFRGASY